MSVKKLYAMILTVGLFGSFAAQAQQPKEVHWLPQTVFAPAGFDDNDNVQIVIDGQLPNTCYRSGTTDVMVDHAKKIVHITDRAYLYQSDYCLMMLVPYTKTVALGVLAAGQYKIEFEGSRGMPVPGTVLNVAKSTNPGPDAYLYAPVTEAFLADRTNRADPVVVLRGLFPNNCLKISNVIVNRTKPDVIEVLPLMESVENSGCRAGAVPFELNVSLRSAMNPAPKGKFLIHVRALNGQSVNVVVY